MFSISLILAAGGVLAFPIALSVTLFVEGIKVIRHEGLKPANLLTMLCSVLLYLYLAVWPVVGCLFVFGRIESDPFA